MATQTTYYNFNKPGGTDLVNPLVDTNPNWDIADAALHELNERSVANCTEVVSLGVHALSTLNTDTKFLKWIATANFTAGETFTLNGIAVAAATPSGASLATDAYVSGAVVMACLNADNTAMTVFLSGTNVAYDSERLGGELPSYYATDSDMDNAQTDITNIQNTLGNTSIVGIGDGTVTGAIDTINSALPDYSSPDINYTIPSGLTFRQALNNLFALIDTTKLTPNSKFVLDNTRVASIITMGSTPTFLSGLNGSSSAISYIYTLDASTSIYRYFGADAGNIVQYGDLSTQSNTFSNFKVYYK